MAETVIGALSVKITADTKGVQDGIKASGKALKIGSQQLRDSANRWGKWALAATAAAAGVAAAIVKSNLASIRELKNLAVAADTQVAAFQRGAFAAKSAGIDTEKYGDILKDVQDRIGDFLIAGSGPLVDFFEVIGPKVGITAEAFKGLSGQDSLGLFVKTLDDANVSQQEMAFFMESLAGDATRLAPLFINDAKAFNALTQEAKDLGIGLSNIDVAKAELASAELAKAGGIIESMTQQATVELAPIIAKITSLFVEQAKEAGGSSEFIKKGIDGIVDVIGVFADGLKGIEIIFKGLELAAVGFSALIANVFAGVSTAVAKTIDLFTGGINTLVNISNDFLGTDFATIPSLENSDFIKSINETADNMIGLVRDTTAELDALLLAPLPSTEIKTFVDEAVKEYEKLAVAKAKALGNERTGGEGVGVKTTSEIELVEAETIGLLEALGLRFASQEEMQLGHLDREREMLAAAFANGELTAIQHSEKLAEIEQQSEDVKRQITLQGIQAGFNALAQGSKKVQKLMAAAATIQAVIKGKEAAVAAWAAGMSVGGPFAPIVAAAYTAASLANTGSIIKSINSGGSSPGSFSGGGFSAGGGDVGAQQQQAPQQQQQQTRIIEARFVGQGSMSMEGVRDLIEQFNEAIGDGAELRVTTG